jgi:hypothetical protein
MVEIWMAGFGALLLRFAFLNQRTADRSRRRVARQLGWLCAYVIGAALAGALLNMVFMLAAVASRR